MKTKKTVCKVVLFAAAFALAVFAGCEMDEEPVQETLQQELCIL